MSPSAGLRFTVSTYAHFRDVRLKPENPGGRGSIPFLPTILFPYTRAPAASTTRVLSDWNLARTER